LVDTPSASFKEVKRKRKHVFGVIGLGIPLLCIFLFVFIPFFFVLYLAIGESPDSLISAIKTVLGGSLFQKIFRFTLIQATISTITSLLIGVPIGYIFWRYEFIGRKVLFALVTVPFILPPLFVILGILRFGALKGFLIKF